MASRHDVIFRSYFLMKNFSPNFFRLSKRGATFKPKNIAFESEKSGFGGYTILIGARSTLFEGLLWAPELKWHKSVMEIKVFNVKNTIDSKV
jgi:hypothetical protein